MQANCKYVRREIIRNPTSGVRCDAESDGECIESGESLSILRRFRVCAGRLPTFSSAMAYPSAIRTMVCVVAMLLALPSALADDARFQAVWIDGSLTEADEVQDWDAESSQPRLGRELLLEGSQPLRSLRDTSLAAASTPEAYVEFFGGDCLPGRVSGLVAASKLPDLPTAAHLVIEPSVQLASVTTSASSSILPVRVLPEYVKRVVWQRRSVDRYQPATLFHRDGRQLVFRSLRWTDHGVRLLLEQGTDYVDYDQIAELHLPQPAPWDMVLRQLATLTPGADSRLMQLETDQGLLITTSLARLLPRSHGERTNPQHWVHVVQPVWSLDPLGVVHRRVRLRRFYDAHEVPLVAIEPAEQLHRAVFGGAWSVPRTNRNVYGGRLTTSGHEAPWGLGVQAQHDLEYQLSPLVVAFRTRMGLDEAAGARGCARGAVYAGVHVAAGRHATTPLYRTSAVIGTGETFDSGRLELRNTSHADARLVLVADMAEHESSPRADPYDILDAWDWVEPIVELAADKLEAELARRALEALPALDDWVSATPVSVLDRWCERPSGASFQACLLSDERTLRLRRTFSRDNSTELCVWVEQGPTEDAAPLEVQVLVNDRPLSAYRASVVGGKSSPERFSLAGIVEDELRVEVVLSCANERVRCLWLGGELIAADAKSHLPKAP